MLLGHGFFSLLQTSTRFFLEMGIHSTNSTKNLLFPRGTDVALLAIQLVQEWGKFLCRPFVQASKAFEMQIDPGLRFECQARLIQFTAR